MTVLLIIPLETCLLQTRKGQKSIMTRPKTLIEKKTYVHSEINN